MFIDDVPMSLPLCQAREVRTLPADDFGDYLVGYPGEVDGEPRFIVVDRAHRFSIAQNMLGNIVEAPGPDLGAFIAQITE